jgi:hypothetical protein
VNGTSATLGIGWERGVFSQTFLKGYYGKLRINQANE